MLLRVGVLPQNLLLRNRQLVGGSLRWLSCGFYHPDQEVDGFGDIESFFLTSVRCVDVTHDCEDSFLCCHLED